MDERRTESRQRCLLSAKIEFNQRQSIIDCTIRDRARAGARLLLSALVEIPPEFDVAVTERQQRQRMRVVWRSSTQVGVAAVA